MFYVAFCVLALGTGLWMETTWSLLSPSASSSHWPQWNIWVSLCPLAFSWLTVSYNVSKVDVAQNIRTVSPNIFLWSKTNPFCNNTSLDIICQGLKIRRKVSYLAQLLLRLLIQKTKHNRKTFEKHKLKSISMFLPVCPVLSVGWAPNPKANIKATKFSFEPHIYETDYF